MTTISYPAVGEGGMPESKWSEVQGAPDGVFDDTTGTAFALSRLTNVARIAPGKVRVNGYVLEVTANEDLSVPATVSGTRSWIIAAKYDPALNVADGSGNAASAGPCRLIITDSTLVTTGGEEYVVLYTFTRTSAQSMSDVTIVDHRVRVARKYQATSLAASLLATLPFGSEVELTAGGRYRRLLDTSNNPAWIRQGVWSKFASAPFTVVAGWSSTAMTNRLLTDPDGVSAQYDIMLRRAGAAFRFDANGQLADVGVCTVNGPKPDQIVPVQFDVMGGATATTRTGLTCWGYLSPSGTVAISTGIPNTYIASHNPDPVTAADYSLRACIRFTKES